MVSSGEEANTPVFNRLKEPDMRRLKTERDKRLIRSLVFLRSSGDDVGTHTDLLLSDDSWDTMLTDYVLTSYIQAHHQLLAKS